MQTSVKHEASEFVVYIGLGGSKALLLYPFWSFKDRGKVGAFGHFQVPRGEGAHLGLFGFHWFSVPTRRKANAKQQEPEPLLPGFVEPAAAAPVHTD